MLGNNSQAQSVKIDSAGGIIVAGTTDGTDYVLRLTSTGQLDTSFGDVDNTTPGGHSGIASLPIIGSQQVALAIRPTGQIVVAGSANFESPEGDPVNNSFVAQFTSAGIIDSSFGNNGVTSIQVNDAFQANTVGLQPNGTAIVGGNTIELTTHTQEFALVAIDSGGHPDNSFGTSGTVQSDVHLGEILARIAVDSSGNIYAADAFSDVNTGAPIFGIYQFTAQGVLNNGYGNGGIAEIDDPSVAGSSIGVTVDSSGRALATGAVFDESGGQDVILARFDVNGNLDTSFAPNGYVVNSFTGEDFGDNVLVQSDGKIIVTGENNDDFFFNARYTNPQAVPPPPPTPVTIDANGNLLIPGTNGDDNIQVLPAGPGSVDVIYNGTDAGVFSPTGIIIATGKNGNDTININSAVTIAASITGGNGNDTLTGGAGNDTINGNADDDSITGGNGDDSLIAGAGNDNLFGGIGNDTLSAGAGNDLLDGGDGNNSIAGGQGIDSITAGNGNNIITGASDNDSITVGDGNNSITGGTGNDSITAGNGNNTIKGGSGDDVIVSGTGQSSIDGDAGNDSITVAGGTTTITGGAGDDTITGGNGADSIDAGAGNDIIVGGLGNDTITGGADRDIIIGGQGADSLIGGGDDDILVGSSTSYDSNLTALNSIKAEWISTNTYAQRIANIRNSTGGTSNRQNGAFFFNNTTVTNDAASDTLTGSAGSDLFYFSSSNDHVTDLGKAETEVNV